MLYYIGFVNVKVKKYLERNLFMTIHNIQISLAGLQKLFYKLTSFAD